MEVLDTAEPVAPDDRAEDGESRAGPSASGALAGLLRQYVAPQWRGTAGLLALLIGSSAIKVTQPRLLAAFVDRAAHGSFGPPLTRLAIAYLVLAGVGQAISVVDVYLAEHLALVATNRLRRDLTLHCLRLDLGFHTEHRPGELIQRIDGDVTSLSNFFSRFVVALIGSGLFLFGVVVMLATVDWRLGLGLGVYCIGIILVVARHRELGRRHWAGLMEAKADHAGFLEEHLSGTEDLRSSGATGYALWRFYGLARALSANTKRASFFGNIVGNLSASAFRFGSAGALAGGAWLFRRGDITIGGVLLVFVYTQMLAEPIQVLNRQIADLQTAAAAVVRIRALFATRTSLPDEGTTALPAGALEIDLRDVTFRYNPDDERPVLDRVSVHVAAGRVLGLLGRTGSGKSTLARLLVRFADPDAGTVSVGGRDTAAVPLAELRHRVALVTQDVQLFHASARDNLTIFDPTVDDAAIVRALDELGLAPWLAALPDGLDTVLAAGATGLSAGEAQLLAFTRVFLRDPSVVILDEATARLDPATERLVEDAIARLFAGRTAIVIAHRLQTLRHVDEVLILDDGRVVEHGPRAQLAAVPTSRLAELLRVGLDGGTPA